MIFGLLPALNKISATKESELGRDVAEKVTVIMKQSTHIPVKEARLFINNYYFETNKIPKSSQPKK